MGKITVDQFHELTKKVVDIVVSDNFTLENYKFCRRIKATFDANSKTNFHFYDALSDWLEKYTV